MNFQKGYLYHIFNQGNNKQKIFYNQDNYLYFLSKIHLYVKPYADILAWCLMPNHFHLMVYVKEMELPVSNVESKKATVSLEATPSLAPTKYRSFNESIGIMLRSYTNAFNKKHKRSGKLFREGTKAECINCFTRITPSFIGNTSTIKPPEQQYPEICFHYIHQNPVKAGLVKTSTDWEFSSARDYAGLRKGKLINIERTREYLNL